MRSRLRDGQPGSDLDFQIFGRVTLRSNATRDLEGGWIRPGATSEYAPGRLQTRAVHFYMLDIEWFVLLGDWPDNPMREARLKEDGTWRTSMEYGLRSLEQNGGRPQPDDIGATKAGAGARTFDVTFDNMAFRYLRVAHEAELSVGQAQNPHQTLRAVHHRAGSAGFMVRWRERERRELPMIFTKAGLAVVAVLALSTSASAAETNPLAHLRSDAYVAPIPAINEVRVLPRASRCLHRRFAPQSGNPVQTNRPRARRRRCGGRTWIRGGDSGLRGARLPDSCDGWEGTDTRSGNP